MRVSKLFCEPKLWTAFEKAAAKEALQWVACRHVQALDSFAWTREKARSGDSEQFFGLVRVAKENVGPLLSSSGQQGVFVSAPRNVPEAAAAACEVVWVDRAPQEKAVTYLERVTRMESSHGLALSNMRLGWRRPLAKDEVPARVWLVTDVPKSWDLSRKCESFLLTLILSALGMEIACCMPSRKRFLHFREEERHPRKWRAELVTHLLKHERYSREWDRLDPQGQPCPDFKNLLCFD